MRLRLLSATGTCSAFSSAHAARRTPLHPLRLSLQFGDRNGFVRNLTRNGEPMRFTTENDLTADDCALGPRTIAFDFINMRRPGPRALRRCRPRRL